jgi:hypothetical protein
MLKIRLASSPYNEPGTRPDWPITRCDGFLFTGDGKLAEPPALIQLASNGRVKNPLPQWRQGDIATLTPLVGCNWNDSEDTGRCFVDLYLSVACEGREGWLIGMLPRNPNIYDLTVDSTA